MGKTVISSEDLAFVFDKEYRDIRDKYPTYCEKGYLRRLHSGLFVIGNESYDVLELAGKVFRPSYVCQGYLEIICIIGIISLI